MQGRPWIGSNGLQLFLGDFLGGSAIQTAGKPVEIQRERGSKPSTNQRLNGFNGFFNGISSDKKSQGSYWSTDVNRVAVLLGFWAFGSNSYPSSKG